MKAIDNFRQYRLNSINDRPNDPTNERIDDQMKYYEHIIKEFKKKKNIHLYVILGIFQKL